MKVLAVVTLFLLLADAPVTPEIRYFSTARDVTVSAPERQSYVALDGEVWRAAKPGLDDLRLYAGASELPYALREMRGGPSTGDQDVTVFNASKVGDRTQFVIDTGSDKFEYNRVSLKLSDDAKNFLARASVEATNDADLARWAKVGKYTLYDFSREKLGSNHTLNLPLSRFRYLFVKIWGLKPEQITGASVARRGEQKPEWIELPAWDVKTEQQGRQTVISWKTVPDAPLEGVLFNVEPSEKRFYRMVRVEDADGREVARGHIRRLKVTRGERSVEEDDVTLEVGAARSGAFKVIIDNGDDRPLRLKGVRPVAFERRLYFDPQGNAQLVLYYGDRKLSAPQYDYARLFEMEEKPVRALLGVSRQNTAYVPRPDDRPWTERHPAVMWTALVIAVVSLGAVALRSLKRD